MGGEDNGFHAGCADFVDGGGFDGGGKTSEDCGLASRRLTDIALEDIAHVDICNFGDGDAGFLEGRFDGYGAEMWCRDGGESTIELCILGIGLFYRDQNMIPKRTFAVGVLEALNM